MRFLGRTNFKTRVSAGTRGTELTLPPGGAGGLNADLHQHVLGRPLLPAVVGGDGQLVLVFFPVVQLLRVLYVPFQGEKQQ